MYLPVQTDGRRNPINVAVNALTLSSRRAPIEHKRVYVPLLPTSDSNLHPCHVSQLIVATFLAAARIDCNAITAIQLGKTTSCIELHYFSESDAIIATFLSTEAKDPIPLRVMDRLRNK
jgi:hypothetical protein